MTEATYGRLAERATFYRWDIQGAMAASLDPAARGTVEEVALRIDGLAAPPELERRLAVSQTEMKTGLRQAELWCGRRFPLGTEEPMRLRCLSFVALTVALMGCASGGSATKTNALQMRPVEKTSGGSCATPSQKTNPPGSSPTELMSLYGDTCFTLGAQVAGLDRAKSVPSSAGSPANPELFVTLPAATSTALNTYAKRNAGRMLAVVMFGKVLEAPRLEASAFNGTIAVTGLTAGQTHRVQTALAP